MSLSDLQGKAALPQQAEPDLPDIIPNSEAQLDGDVSCYYAAWTDMSLGLCIKQLKQHIEVKRLLSGCEFIRVHTTQGAKAGREDYAKVTPYQDVRKKNKDPEKSARVHELRQFLQNYKSETVIPYPQFDIEADDSMNIMQRKRIAGGMYSTIITKDKDLDMCPGNHHTYDDLEPFEVPDGYGELWIDERQVPANTAKGYTIKKKVKGIGTSFFWAQLLMGDTADSIPGLPKLSAKLLNRYVPTKAIDKALAALSNPRSKPLQIKSANKALQKRNSATVGQITAFKVLEGCKDDREAFKRVREAYREHYSTFEFEFTDWRGKTETMTAGKMLLEQARLLWMLRTPEDDALKFLQEVMIGKHDAQR